MAFDPDPDAAFPTIPTPGAASPYLGYVIFHAPGCMAANHRIERTSAQPPFWNNLRKLPPTRPMKA
ncbi:MAG: hypothetical protein WCY72_13680, partial [Lysobacteraceae bacterium]